MKWRSRILIVFLLTLLLFSLGLNYYFFNLGLQYYRDLNETRLDPLGLSYFTELTEVADETIAVFFGDSRAASWSPPPNLSGFEFINRGIGAQTSAQVVQRFDEHIIPLQPDILIIQVGINDLKTIPLFPERKEAIIEDCKDNIFQIVSQSVELGTTVILTTIFPIGTVPIERRYLWSDDVPAAVNEVNDYLRTLEGDEVIILDAFFILADEHGVMRPEYNVDTLHINQSGYNALNVELSQLLEASA